jgi:hypothetical protein
VFANHERLPWMPDGPGIDSVVSNMTYTPGWWWSDNAIKLSAAANEVLITPSARCNDYTLSYSAEHSGTCSSHGGVAVFYR